MRTALGVLAAALALLASSTPAVGAAASSTPAAGPAAAAAEQAPPAERAAAARLARRYVPIAMLREQQDPPCETSAEQYQPTSVETVLGNPTVALTHYVPGLGLLEVKRAPTATDIAGLGDGYYLDLEGKVLGKTCVYARAFAELLAAGKAPAVTYAHIAREPNHSGFTLQYWFFWYFNQFNDLHEGDWEGMQVSFEAETPSRALSEEPSQIILFQHAGGERADWDDTKVQKRGTHPIVYPAAGSHATFYDSAVYIENGQHGSGLGCDNTSEPLRELSLRPVLLPDTAGESGPFRWLSYRGRWGEREMGFNNGPTGPATKTVWREPFAWMEQQRTTSPRMPGGSLAGPQVTAAFCGVVATGSDLINLDARSRLAAALTVLVVLAVLGLFVGITRWRPIDLDQLRARRAFGQLVRTARRLYQRHWRVLVPVGLGALVLLGGTNLLAGMLGNSHGVSRAAGRSGVNLALADLVETLARPVAQALVAAVVIVFVRELVERRPTGLRAALASTRQRFWRVVGAQLLATLGVLAMALTVVGIPFAIWKLVGWAFVQQEVLFTDKSIRQAFRGSSALVRGRWWHAVRAIVFFNVLLVVAGPILTFALIFTSFNLIWINLLGSLIFALLIPYVALGTTLLYFDLQARAEEDPGDPAPARSTLGLHWGPNVDRGASPRGG